MLLYKSTRVQRVLLIYSPPYPAQCSYYESTYPVSSFLNPFFCPSLLALLKYMRGQLQKVPKDTKAKELLNKQ